MNDSKYYWLKLKRDFFKRHDIRIVEGMPNGKEYILFYLKLLCESVDHEGSLRFSDQIPYNEEMLSIITDTNIDIVRSAVKVFTELHMMEVLSDGTLFMNEVEGMIGSAANNENANRQRRFREKQKTEALPMRYESVTKSNESKSKSIEIDTELDTEIDINTYSAEAPSEPIKKAGQFESECEEIIDYLNMRTGAHYRNVSSNSKFISARLKDGYTVQNCKDVIDKKCVEWMNTDMQQFLRPKTLFNATNFESYMNAPVKQRKGQNVF